MGATDRTLACPECGSLCSPGVKFCAECGIPLSSLDLDLGTLVGNYRLLEVVGEGGMGRVYVAEHIKLGRRVAIKKLRIELVSNPSAVARFFAEARAVNRISHDNIVEITDFVEQPGGDNYIVMELLRGEDLAHRLQRKRSLPLARAFDIAAQTASALAAVHAAGMIHRDLKPDNIFLIERGGSPDFVKVLDFGVAKLTTVERGGVATHVTAAGQIIGTPEYMSPEQAGGVAVDFRTDIYALGVILYEMLTGHLPFQARSFGDLLIQHMSSPVNLPGASPGLPHNIQSGRDQLLLDLLAKQPGDRPPSMGEVELRIRGLLDVMDLPQPPKRRAVAASHVAIGAEVTPILIPKSTTGPAGVARLALIKRQTPVVEISSPRSVSRIEVPTPGAMRVAPATPLPAGAPAARLARASTDCQATALEEHTPVQVEEGGRERGDATRRIARPGSEGRLHGAGSSPGAGVVERKATRPRGEGRGTGSRPESAGSDGPARITRPILEVPSLEGLDAEVATAGAVTATRRATSDVSGEATGELRPTPVPGHAARPGAARLRRGSARRSFLVIGALSVVAAAGFLYVQLRRADLPAAASPVEQPAEIKIKFVSAPPGASVRLAGTEEVLGITPFTQRFPRSARTVSVELAKPGFEKVVEDLTLAADNAVAATLLPLATPPLPSSAGSEAVPTAAGSAATLVAPPAPAAPAVTPKPDRPRRVPAKAGGKSDPAIDRNGTLDVFKAQ